MRACSILLVLFTVSAATACASSDKAPPGVGGSAPDTVDARLVGAPCASETDCVAPAQCIDVVGMQPESARRECWVTCGDDAACPAGLHCTMVFDGPGQVCVARDG